MAHTIVHLENPRTGQRRQAPVGFSWTNLFFGFFVPLFRSDWKWAVIQFFAALVTCGLCWLVFPFIYNRLYLRELQNDGYNFIESINSPGSATQPGSTDSVALQNTATTAGCCPKCGNDANPEGSAFCCHCGSPIPAQPPAVEMNTVETIPTSRRVPQQSVVEPSTSINAGEGLKALLGFVAGSIAGYIIMMLLPAHNYYAFVLIDNLKYFILACAICGALLGMTKRANYRLKVAIGFLGGTIVGYLALVLLAANIFWLFLHLPSFNHMSFLHFQRILLPCLILGFAICGALILGGLPRRQLLHARLAATRISESFLTNKNWILLLVLIIIVVFLMGMVLFRARWNPRTASTGQRQQDALKSSSLSEKNCPTERDGVLERAKEPVEVIAKLTFHDGLRPWVGVTPPTPICGSKGEIEAAFLQKPELRKLKALNGCKVRVVGLLEDNGGSPYYATDMSLWGRTELAPPLIEPMDSCNSSSANATYEPPDPGKENVPEYIASVTVHQEPTPHIETSAWMASGSAKNMLPSDYADYSVNGSQDILYGKCLEGYTVTNAWSNTGRRISYFEPTHEARIDISPKGNSSIVFRCKVAISRSPRS